jgi:acyl dehydratase
LKKDFGMAKQIYFEDIEVGYELAPLEKHPTTQQLVKYAGASGDYYQIHYDKDFALANGLPGVILHGALKNAFLGQLMTDFAGDEGWLRKLSVQYRPAIRSPRRARCPKSAWTATTTWSSARSGWRMTRARRPPPEVRS